MDSNRAELTELGLTAARRGNRVLARHYLEQLASFPEVDPSTWLWLAWLAESPEQASQYLTKLQPGPFAPVAQAGSIWLETLQKSLPPLTTVSEAKPVHDPLPSARDRTTKDLANSDFGLQCPGCGCEIRIKARSIGVRRHCPGCDAAFIVEPHPQDHTRLIRRHLPPEPKSVTLSSQETQAPAETGFQAGTVLLIIDQWTIQQAALGILRKAGFHVLTASDEESGMLIATSQVPRLVIIDLCKSGSDACGACRRLREHPLTRSVPIVLLSSRSDFFDLIQARVSGCTVYLTKPLEGHVLVDTVIQHILTGEMSASFPRHLPVSDSRISARENHEDLPSQLMEPTRSGNSSCRVPVVLVVDDSPTVRRIAASILSAHGYRVLMAASAAEAFANMAVETVSLVAIDEGLPDLEGYSLALQLRQSQVASGIPVVLMLNEGSDFDAVRASGIGQLAYLQKPCEASVLLAKVAEFVAPPIDSPVVRPSPSELPSRTSASAASPAKELIPTDQELPGSRREENWPSAVESVRPAVSDEQDEVDVERQSVFF